MPWHQILPALGDFINKTGFPIALWIIAGFIFYKVFQKFFKKLEPVIDAHFELVTELKNNSTKSTNILEQQNHILSTKLDEHTGILKDHTDTLEKILKINEKRNELLEQSSTKKTKASPSNNGSIGSAHGTKR